MVKATADGKRTMDLGPFVVPVNPKRDSSNHSFSSLTFRRHEEEPGDEFLGVHTSRVG